MQPCVLDQWTLDISLETDYIPILSKWIAQNGYTFNSRIDDLYQLLNIAKRMIQPKPRKVVHSMQFSCPEGYEIALLELENKIKKGDDLSPFMTEKLSSDYNDLLLNDWGIYHFHLSRRYRDDGLIQRSNYLIFAFVTDTTIYFIKVYNHNSDQSDNLFSKQEMIQILYDNWPELIEPYCLDDATLEYTIDDSTYQNYRQANISTFVQLKNGKLFSGLGGGYASNGRSMEVVMYVNQLRKQFYRFERLIFDKRRAILESINIIHDEKEIQFDLKFELVRIIDFDEIILYERNNRFFCYADIKKRTITMYDYLFNNTKVL